MSVNSVAVLRLMGKGVGGAAPAGVVRGRGATRGGRGKNQRIKKKTVVNERKATPQAQVTSSLDATQAQS